jgi:hypothetical protein
MERSEILTAMAELKLYGMKAAFDGSIGTAVKRQQEPTPSSPHSTSVARPGG